MNKFNIDKHFVSEYDIYMHDFDKKHARKSESQLREIKKFNRIAELRDNPKANHADRGEIWEEF